MGNAGRDSKEPHHDLIYEIEDPHGQKVQGTSSGISDDDLRRRLTERGCRVLSITRVDPEALDQLPPEQRDAPVQRVVRVLLEAALRDNAHAIEMTLAGADQREEDASPIGAEERHGVRVTFLAESEPRHAMTLVHYTWQPLRDHLAGMAGLQPGEQPTPQTGRIRFHFEGQDHDLKTVIGATNIRIETG